MWLTAVSPWEPEKNGAIEGNGSQGPGWGWGWGWGRIGGAGGGGPAPTSSQLGSCGRCLADLDLRFLSRTCRLLLWHKNPNGVDGNVP